MVCEVSDVFLFFQLLHGGLLNRRKILHLRSVKLNYLKVSGGLRRLSVANGIFPFYLFSAQYVYVLFVHKSSMLEGFHNLFIVLNIFTSNFFY